MKEVKHPGKILAAILHEDHITMTAFAKKMDVPSSRLSEILSGKRSITVDSAVRIGRVLDEKPQDWLALQDEFDLCQYNLAS